MEKIILHKDLLLESARLNSVKDITDDVLDAMARRAQQQYDDWVLNDEGYDEEVGGGGICHLIADDLIDELFKHKIYNCQTVCSTYEQHVYVVGKFKEGVYLIDLPYHVYEQGGGFTWKKIPDVKFERNHIVISCLDKNPKEFKQYVDDF